MTGAPPVLDRPALRDALSHMQIQMPGTEGRFEEALAREQGWSLTFAERVTDEYCGFLYLAATAVFEVTPSEAVDKAWHLHLELPHYREILCGKILDHPLEHRPGTGEPDEEERYRRQYEATLALYEQVFGKPPPADIWPRPIAEEAEAPEDDWKPTRRLGRRIAYCGWAAGAAAAALGAEGLGVFLAWFGLVAFFVSFAGSVAARGRQSGACGSGSGCGGGGSSDGCASCGGSCGGGGCGGGGD